MLNTMTHVALTLLGYRRAQDYFKPESVIKYMYVVAIFVRNA